MAAHRPEHPRVQRAVPPKAPGQDREAQAGASVWAFGTAMPADCFARAPCTDVQHAPFPSLTAMGCTVRCAPPLVSSPRPPDSCSRPCGSRRACQMGCAVAVVGTYSSWARRAAPSHSTKVSGRVAGSHTMRTSCANSCSALFIQMTICCGGTLRTRAAAKEAPPDLAFGQSLSHISEPNMRMEYP